jgi:1-acyl-sn-glycerol-3-phosphate acyltransferase
MMHKLNLFVRSLIFWAFSISLIFVYSFICLFSLVFPIHVRHKFLRFFVVIYLGALKVICRIDNTVEGMENIPAQRFGVVLCKHSSAWETFFVPTIFQDAAVIAKRELLWIPFFGWGIAAAAPILINRKDKSTAMQQVITQGKKCMEDGRWILVFPEGTRIPAGKAGKYHLGGARLAIAAGAPVIPVAHNAGYFWPKRGFIKNPGTIRVVIGPPIETKGRTAEEVTELAKTWIEDTIARIGGLVDKPAS